MVSLEERQSLAALSEADPHHKNFQLLVAGNALTRIESDPSDVREKLLQAISSKDSVRFKDTAFKIGERKISPDSDWCNDDYLIFLLILGNELFGRPLIFLANVFEARRKTSNPIPRKVNEVFAALERQEFAIDGEFCFLKIPFLSLAGKLRLSPVEAKKAIAAMSAPDLFDQMSPFLRLLTQKAYDIVLTERMPLPTETTTQLIEGFEQHAKDLSLRQWSRVVVALPGRLIFAIIATLFSVGLIPVLIGVGKGVVDWLKPKEVYVRPQSLSVTGVREAGSELPAEALLLAKALPSQTALPGKKSLLLTVESAPFSFATPAFVVEASHPEKTIRNAFAFTQSSTAEARSFTIVPVQRDSGRFRAILPTTAAGQRLYFVLEIEVGSDEDFMSIGRRIVLRPLQ